MMIAFKKFGKLIEGVIRELRFAPRVYMKYGTFFPSKVMMPNAVGAIHINPRDRRAKKKVLFDSIRGRYTLNRKFWNDFVAAESPDVALDIGVNYGECLFSSFYPMDVHAIGFEANPELFPYLEKSHGDHPCQNNILLINALVDKESSGKMEFYVNKDWSGGSTAVSSLANESANTLSVQVETVSVDSILRQRDMLPGTIVFKIDVEGYEPRVLLGMKNTISNCKRAVGFIEVDTAYLAKAGWSASRYDSEVLYQFDLYVPVSKGGLNYKQISSLDAYCSNDSSKSYHFDLIVIKKGSIPGKAPNGWTFEAS